MLSVRFCISTSINILNVIIVIGVSIVANMQIEGAAPPKRFFLFCTLRNLPLRNMLPAAIEPVRTLANLHAGLVFANGERGLCQLSLKDIVGGAKFPPSAVVLLLVLLLVLVLVLLPLPLPLPPHHYQSCYDNPHSYSDLPTC